MRYLCMLMTCLCRAAGRKRIEEAHATNSADADAGAVARTALLSAVKAA